MTTRPTTFLGIDPAARRDGFGVCIRDRSDRSVRMFKFRHACDFFAWLWSEDAPDPALCDVIVAVENSDKEASIFQFQTDRAGRAFVLDGKGQKRYLNHREAAAIGERVGKNKAISAEVVVACEKRYPGRVMNLTPREKGEKLSHKYFISILQSNRETLLSEVPTGINGQDDRDAYKLALIAEQQRNIYFQRKSAAP